MSLASLLLKQLSISFELIVEQFTSLANIWVYSPTCLCSAERAYGRPRLGYGTMKKSYVKETLLMS